MLEPRFMNIYEYWKIKNNKPNATINEFLDWISIQIKNEKGN